MPTDVAVGVDLGNNSMATLMVWHNGVLLNETRDYEVSPDGTIHMARGEDGAFQTSICVNGRWSELSHVTSSSTPYDFVHEDMVKHPEIGEGEET